ncbi:MAG: peptidylprolyl isomerase [Legionellaceae bacterium]|nr:peptidylprolyl isomerase [Legionellaceae bacterium]|tara:strand:- start:146 stop:595 length:450 start_codon:yes stop_codon:yes gene_type:complete
MTEHVQAGSAVEMHVKIMLKDKSVAQDTKDDDMPVKVEVGAGHFTETFEKHLLGLKVGDKNTFMVEPEDAFGEPNPDNIHFLPRDQFPKDENVEQGVIYLFAQPNGQELPGVVRAVQEDQIKVDFNHPLCGQDLIFEVEILKIDSPVKH